MNFHIKLWFELYCSLFPIVNKSALKQVMAWRYHTRQAITWSNVAQYVWRNMASLIQHDLLPGPRFNIKMSSYQYRKYHCGDKTVVRSSYLHNGISYTGKTTSLFWIRALVGGKQSLKSVLIFLPILLQGTNCGVIYNVTNVFFQEIAFGIVMCGERELLFRPK